MSRSRVNIRPPLGLLAAAIASSPGILYPSQHSTLAYQRNPAALMWVAPMLVLVPVALLIVVDWMRAEERTDQRIPAVARLRDGVSRGP